MDIIDRKTGKRLDNKGSKVENLKKLKEVDPIIANAEKQNGVEEASPMDPPDPYNKSYNVEGPSFSEMDVSIQSLVNEHDKLTEKLNLFEKAIMSLEQNQFYITKEINDGLNQFFVFFDEHVIPHNRKEERYLFPILQKRLIESGEHGGGNPPITAIDIMEDDHVKFIQLATLTFNLLGLAIRLNDKGAQATTFDLAVHNGKELVELLKLHVYKEDHTLFPLAHKLLSKEEFEAINKEMNEFISEVDSSEENHHHAH